MRTLPLPSLAALCELVGEGCKVDHHDVLSVAPGGEEEAEQLVRVLRRCRDPSISLCGGELTPLGVGEFDVESRMDVHGTARMLRAAGMGLAQAPGTDWESAWLQLVGFTLDRGGLRALLSRVDKLKVVHLE